MTTNIWPALKFWGSLVKLTAFLVSLGLPLVVFGQQPAPANAKGPPSASEPPAQIGTGQSGKKVIDPNARPEWVRERIEATNGHYKTFKSKTIGQKLSYFIYIPAAYEQSKEGRFPVLYWLHGMGGGQGGIPILSERFNTAIAAGKTPPLLIVFVNGMRNSFYCDSADGKTPVETVIVKDLIPHIDTTYRTIARRDGRIVEGFSMGGFGAVHLGFKYPELFGTVSIIDGSLTDATAMQTRQPELYQRIFGGDEKRFAAEDPRQLAAKNQDAIRGRTKIRLAVGLLKPVNLSFHQQLTDLKIDHDYDAFDVGHNPVAIFDSLGDENWNFYREALSNRQD